MRALYGEVEHNIGYAKKNLTVESTSFNNFATFPTSCYDKACLSGELTTLSKNLQGRIVETYRHIGIFNKWIEDKEPCYKKDELDKIVELLSELRDGMPKELKFLEH